MRMSASQPRLQIKSANVDDVPTFSVNGADLSEQLAFRRPERCIGARPKTIYRPPPPPSFTAIGESNELEMASEARSSSTGSDLLPVAALRDEQELLGEPAEEQRPRPLGSKPARQGILKRKHLRNGIWSTSSKSMAGLRVSFAVQEPLPGTHADAASSPKHPSSTSDVPETDTLTVKQEREADDPTGKTIRDGVRSRFSVSPGTVKAEHVQCCQKREPATDTESTLFFPSAEANHQPSSCSSTILNEFDTVDNFAALEGQLTSQETFTYVVECAAKLLSLVDVPPPRQLRRYRRFAHHLLAAASISRISTDSLNIEKLAALRLLRNVLKHMLELTAITKLPTSEVRAEECKSAQARCERRLQSILNVASDMLSVPRVRLPTERQSIPEVKMEEDA
ncbi:mucin [Pseudozyma hubeiensis SY62]|uniref:Mucin n=1 Tax=Pseudozyma hubeiensis (strain SY62) TaxID=1305764 RepID=R9NYQ9_PSEHS|nr:mucin [Pseudozyma hubeiensis SY62]GAC93953.1 mucin [Pseudozyma hubeiensis SY62]